MYEPGQEVLLSSGPKLSKTGLLILGLARGWRRQTHFPVCILPSCLPASQEPPGGRAPPPEAPGAVREKVSLGVGHGHKGQSTRRS